MQFAKRMEHFQPGVFSIFAQKKREHLAQGRKVIDLTIGAPNIPPSPHILEVIANEVKLEKNYVYAVKDLGELREAAAGWYERRFGVSLNPHTQITSLLGEQDGLAHISLSIIDPGDLVLIPNPQYPTFAAGPLLAGAELFHMPLHRDKGYLIDFSEIPAKIAKRAKLMIVSYPNNPTTAIAPDFFYKELIAFAKRNDIIVLHDNAYSEIVFDNNICSSFLAYDGAIDIGVEFSSLSKTYGLAGARVGFCLGNEDICSNLERLKSNIDYGIFLPLQKASIAALTGNQTSVAQTCAAYKSRRDALCNGLRGIGWPVEIPPATIFVWTPLPKPYTNSQEFCDMLFEKCGVLITPGSAFGEMGEGYVRMALVHDENTLTEAVELIEHSGILLEHAQ